MANSIFIELTLEDKGTPEIRKFSAEAEKGLKKAERAHVSFAEKATGSMARAAGSAKKFSDRVLGLNERASEAVREQNALAKATTATAGALEQGAASAAAFTQELGNVASAAGAASTASSVFGEGDSSSIGGIAFEDVFGPLANKIFIPPKDDKDVPIKSARYGFSGVLRRDTIFQAHRGERIDITPPSRRGAPLDAPARGRGDSFTINIDARGADLDERRVAQKVEAAILRLKRRRHTA